MTQGPLPGDLFDPGEGDGRGDERSGAFPLPSQTLFHFTGVSKLLGRLDIGEELVDGLA